MMGKWLIVNSYYSLKPMAKPSFPVILSEVKDLNLLKNKILRYAQNDISFHGEFGKR